MMDEPSEKEQFILHRAVLSHEIFLDAVPSGLAENLLLLIAKTTDISEESILQKVQASRDKLGMADDFFRWKVHIIKSLNYTPEQVDKMTIDKFLECVVLAEEVLGAPLVAVGKDDGVDVHRETPSMDQPEEIENADMNQVANNMQHHLREFYKTSKIRRKKVGG